MYIKRIILLLVLSISNFVYAQSTYGPLTPGDTLWVIAAKVSPSDEVSRHQMIIALLHANPQAFSIPCNINSLRINQVLHIPSLDEIKKYTHAEAIAMYNQQNAAWQARRQVEIQCDEPPKSENLAAASIPEIPETPETPEIPEIPEISDSSEPVEMYDEQIMLPTIEPPSIVSSLDGSEALADAPNGEISTASQETEEITAANIAETTEQINYLPIIIILGIVAFVFTLAFLLRDSIKSRPIPEDLT